MALQLSRIGKGKGPGRERDPTESLTSALRRFQDVLSPEERKEFKSVSVVPDAAGVLFFVAKLDAENASTTRRSIAPRLCNFLTATQQFAGAVETFVSSNPTIAALVWGGIKTAIVVASNVTSYFDKVTNMIMQIGRFCPTFQQFGKLYHGCIGLQQALCDYYSVIVDLCVKIVEVSRRTFAIQTISSIWSPFESDFKPFLDQLELATKDITLQASLASKQADDEAKRLLEYESKENSSFRPSALAFFRKAIAQSEEAREWQLNHMKREMGSLKIEIRRNLSSVDHIDPWKRVLKKRVRSTAEWLTQEPAFLGWKNSSKTAILWCSGTMGMGKTVLMSNVISQLHSSGQKNETVAHFFCLTENESSLSARNIIGSISRQLLDSLIEQSGFENLSSMRDESQHLDTSETVQFLLSKLVPERTYYIVLDGLDECTSNQIQEMARAIASIAKQTIVKLKILCAGRPDLEEDLFTWCRPQHRVVIDKQKLDLDINRYIIVSLDECLESRSLVLRDPTNIAKIFDVLHGGSQGMFLWISLCIGELCEQNCDEDILHTLNHLPRGLAELFDSKIRRIREGSEHIHALKLIQWCGVMKRPLTVEEYREALSISKDDKTLNKGRMPNNINRIVRRCYGLTFIEEEDDTVHYIHQSVKEHLFHTTQEATVRFDARRVDEHIGILCMTYLNFTNFNRQLVKAEKDCVIPVHPQNSLLATTSPLTNKIAQKLLAGKERSTSMKFRDFERTLESLNVYQSQGRNIPTEAQLFPFLAYAKENWVLHLKDFCIDQEPEMWTLFCKCIEDRTLPLSRPWESPTQEALVSDKRKGMFFRDQIWTNFLLEMAKYVGHPEHVWAWALLQAHFVLFRYLIKNPNPSRSPRAFQKARWSFLPFDDGKSYRRAELLIQLPSFAPCWGQALSSVALDTGLHEPERSRVSLTLLDKMSKINEDHARFSLGLALRHTLPPTDGFKLMLSINKAFYSGVGVINNDLTYYNTKLNFSSPGKDLEAPLLIIASQKGDNAALSDILQMGADVKVRDHLGRTALVVAAMNGHWATLEILVTANSDLDTKSTTGETALHLASKNNHIGAVRFLISAGASINERDSHMATALHVAVSMGHQDVMKSLLEASADINLRNNAGETPLHLSTSEGRLDEMRILLAACPDLEWKDYRGETALQKAVKRQYHDAISLLKAAGADDRVEHAVYAIQSDQAAKESVTSRMALIQSYKAAKEQISPKMPVAERSHIAWPDTYERLDEDEPLLSFPR